MRCTILQKFGFESKRNKNKDEHVKTVKTFNVTIINEKNWFPNLRSYATQTD